MKIAFAFIVAALIGCSVAASAKCPASTCKLALCNDMLRAPTVRPNYSGNMLRGNGVNMGGALCYPRARSTPRRLVQVKLGQAKVSVQKSGNPLVAISTFPGVTPAFPANYFTVIKMPSGSEKITRRKASGNQFEKTDNLCIELPVKSYRMERPDGSISRKTTGGADDCVAIRVQAMKLMYEMVWNNTDNIDFKVVEPTGERISRRNTVSSSGGRFHTNVGWDRCGLSLIPGELSRETVSWDIDEVPPTGVYTAIAKLDASCGNGPVKATLRVTLNGVVMKQRSKIIHPDSPSKRQFFSVGFSM